MNNKNNKYNFFKSLKLFCLSIGVASCGGSGNSSPQLPPLTPPPPPQFAEVTSGSGIRFAVEYSQGFGELDDVTHFAGGVAAGDYDNDGDIDLFVVRGDIGPNLLYRNEGNNTFIDVADAAGLAYTRSATETWRHSGPMFADLDGDGDLDLFIGGVQGDPCFVFANNGDGTFTDVTSGSGFDAMGASQSVSAGFGDYDLDGDLDIFVAHWGTARSEMDPGDTEHLWRNDSTPGNIQFVSVSVEAEISPSIINMPDPRVTQFGRDYTFAPSFVRINDDLYPDLVTSADFNTSMWFTNDGDGTFTNQTDPDVIIDTNGMGSAVGDYDNDGDLDWFVSSIYRANDVSSSIGNRLYRNDAGAFVDVTDTAGVSDGDWGWAACFVDLNNDGFLDIYHTNGWPIEVQGDFTRDLSRAFIADGTGGFSEQAVSLGIADSGQGRGAVCTDFDNDGDVDIFLWSSNDTNGGRLFRNDTSANNYLRVRLNGLPPNTAAAGARIHATIAGVTQMREISIGSNFVSQNTPLQIFGAGTAAQFDSVTIEWPDGQMSDLGTVAANQTLDVDHPGL